MEGTRSRARLRRIERFPIATCTAFATGSVERVRSLRTLARRPRLSTSGSCGSIRGDDVVGEITTVPRNSRGFNPPQVLATSSRTRLESSLTQNHGRRRRIRIPRTTSSSDAPPTVTDRGSVERARIRAFTGTHSLGVDVDAGVTFSEREFRSQTVLSSPPLWSETENRGLSIRQPRSPVPGRRPLPGQPTPSLVSLQHYACNPFVRPIDGVDRRNEWLNG